VPLVTGLWDVANQTENPDLARVIRKIHEDVTQGETLASALEAQPSIFPKAYVNVVVSGQESGHLGTSLERLAAGMEWNHETLHKLKSSLYYPAVLALAVLGLFILIVTFLIPRLTTVFEKAGAELPLITRMTLAVSHALTGHWPIIVAGLGLVITSFVVFRRTETGGLMTDRLLLRLPVVGKLLRMVNTATFTNMLGLLISSGVHVVRALEISKDSIGNAAMRQDIQNVHARVLSGESMAASLDEAHVLPLLVQRMVTIGEQSGMMTDALERISSYYDKEVPRQVKKFMAFVEPAITICMGVAVGVAVFSGFMPMMKLLTALGK
ncbi:MAG: type II secretion system F family protein, partial [Planctomycetes bacterium]|nr:type II secretion system F family protein [Planctomycetota bacterium]